MRAPRSADLPPNHLLAARERLHRWGRGPLVPGRPVDIDVMHRRVAPHHDPPTEIRLTEKHPPRRQALLPPLQHQPRIGHQLCGTGGGVSHRARLRTPKSDGTGWSGRLH